MKIYFFSYLLAASAVAFMACNDSTTTAKNENEKANSDTSTAVTSDKESSVDETGVPRETPSFASVDAKTSASVNEIVAHYLHVKNALAQDNASEAANGAKAMVDVMEKVDHSAIPKDQMKMYMDVAETLKEHAEHTAENAGNIIHQREHFVMMSDDMYELVKGFGADRTLYVDHCPMANNNKGANWLSEKKEIANPYMGKKMPTCGKVEKLVKR